MPGRNLYKLSATERILAKSMRAINSSCVFVSYRRTDYSAARKIADYLKNDVGVDIYFDEDDYGLSSAASVSDHNKVVDFIELGIATSTHILGVVSNSTRESWWVPYEIGAARQNVVMQVAYVVLDDVKLLPSYFQISKRILSDDELKNWATTLDPTRLAKTYLPAVPRPSIPGLPSYTASRSATLMLERAAF
jgi:TIR domain